MTKIADVAKAFVEQRVARCHNSEVQIYTSHLHMCNNDPVRVLYKLHGHTIAEYGTKERIVTFDWCGHYTVTTANHMNMILAAMNKLRDGRRIGRAHDRDHGISVFNIPL